MAKTLRVEHCWQCPHMQYSALKGEHYCFTLHTPDEPRWVSEGDVPLPDWCPLPDADATAWTPVTEATMPDTGEELWLTDGKQVERGELVRGTHCQLYWYSRQRGWWGDVGDSRQPTHWQPYIVPAPPEAKE